jgi:protein-S-isoprenylcysteine O-methyltransferase Ste14
MYVALCFISIGIGIFFNSIWILLSFMPSAVIVYYIAIKKEEAYLEEKFGEEYVRYKNNVRRWL